MAERHETKLKPPAAPDLIAPRNEAVVDGSSVTFEWEPVEEAVDYLLEVATDTQFETVLVEQVTEDTALTVTGLPLDGSVLFWRVFARNEAGESEGDNIESFVAVSPAEAERERGIERPDEEFGPGAELVRAATVEVAADLSESEALHQAEAEMGVEHEGIEAKQIMAIVVVIVLALVLILFTLYAITGVTAQTVRERVAASAQYYEVRELEAEATQRLSRYEAVDEEAGVYRIPIERAMELMVEEAEQESVSRNAPEGLVQPAE